MSSADGLDRLAILKKYAPDVAGRIELIDNYESSVLDEIGTGVLFVMAFWSGSSVLSFQELGRVLHEEDPENRIRLFVLDIDDIDQSIVQQSPFNDVAMGGNGESFWISKGEIVADSGVGQHFDCIRPGARRLLGMDA